MKKENAIEGFYQKCAELLGAKHAYKKFPYGKRTRWNNRSPGNGRFVGHGLIRMFSPSLIRISLTVPRHNGTYSCSEDALVAIQKALTNDL